MSVKVFDNSKHKWLSKIRQHMISEQLEAVFLKRKSNAYPFSSYSEAKEWVDKLKNNGYEDYSNDEWQFYEEDKLLSKNM
ncbi:hypothetical protein [uncultured Lactobacillus sp.]|uniref:hypothetical protein n=1 Tax=uncultured Lactobacillus sp. TaxID=153152 RepID=UPI0025DF8E4D|nr:hypothetical protein [uncultured Lactobacillus sp.]